jgi:predicted dithiol-disulfide oxidoreductase (DUF899 family)
MVRVEKDYVFTDMSGEHGLADLFEGERQLIVQHFMFDPSWDEGCPSCTAGSDEISAGLLRHLRARQTNLVVVSRAPIEKLERYKATRGWTFPWYSSFGSDFNYDFHATLDESVAPAEYNYRSKDEPGGFQIGPGESMEQPGASTFLRVGDDVFHTYSTYARGLEATGGSYYFLDLTALGRQEEWEEPKGRAADARASIPDFAS